MASSKPNQKLNEIIHYKKIYLRLLSSGDVSEKYTQWMNDPKTTQFIENRDKSHTVEKLKQYVKKFYESQYDYLFGIYIEKTNEHIGNIKIGTIHPQHMYADVGIMIGEKQYWGQGYGTQAIQAVTDLAFSKLRLHKLYAQMLFINKGSFKAFINAGYEHVGTLKKHVLFENKYVDTLIVEKVL